MANSKSRDKEAVENGLSDILGSVINNDRRSGGRTVIAPSRNDARTSSSQVSSSDPPVMKKPSNEETFIPSFEGAHVGRKEGTGAPAHDGTLEGTGAPSHPPSLEASHEAPFAVAGDRNAGWLEGVIERAKAETTDGKTSRLNVDIDEDLHLRLKLHCMSNRITLRKLIPVLLEAYLASVTGHGDRNVKAAGD